MISFGRNKSPMWNPVCYYFSYVIGLLLVVIWALAVPFSRVLLGAHSIDQITYGSLLGIWNAFTCHLVLRDHLIVHLYQLTKKERNYFRSMS